MKRGVIIGLGDVLNGDEGLGCFLLEALAKDLPIPSDSVELTYLGNDPRWAGGLIYNADVAIIVATLKIGGPPGRIQIWSHEVFRQHMAWMVNEFQIIHLLVQALARTELAGGFPKELLLIWIEPEETTGFGISRRIQKAIWKVRHIIKRRLFENGFLPKETLTVSQIVRFEIFGTPADSGRIWNQTKC